MRTPLKITLDTNCIINLLDDNSNSATSLDALGYIMDLGRRKDIDLAITTRFHTDQSNDKDKMRVAKIAQKLTTLPVETVGSTFRLDLSTLDGSDALGDQNIVAMSKELERILVPSGLNAKKNTFVNNINDIDHLIGHFVNKRDIFITDDGDILKKSATIRNVIGITIMSPTQLERFIRDRIIQSLATLNLSKVDPGFESTASIGTVSFDYSNNSGIYTIGEGIYKFETSWSKSGDRSIHAYRNGSSVVAVARVKDKLEINEIVDASFYDYSSRVRTIHEGEILLLKNIYDAYAALKIYKVLDDTRGHKEDLLTFRYVINEVGSADFTSSKFPDLVPIP